MNLDDMTRILLSNANIKWIDYDFENDDTDDIHNIPSEILNVIIMVKLSDGRIALANNIDNIYFDNENNPVVKYAYLCISEKDTVEFTNVESKTSRPSKIKLRKANEDEG